MLLSRGYSPYLLEPDTLIWELEPLQYLAEIYSMSIIYVSRALKLRIIQITWGSNLGLSLLWKWAEAYCSWSSLKAFQVIVCWRPIPGRMSEDYSQVSMQSLQGNARCGLGENNVFGFKMEHRLRHVGFPSVCNTLWYIMALFNGMGDLAHKAFSSFLPLLQ